MRKTKKRAKKSKPRLKTTIDSAVEEHIRSLAEISQTKKEIKQSIDAVVKKESKKAETKTKKSKKAKVKTKDVYGKRSKDEYQSLHGAGIYDQIRFSPFAGFVYKSNIKENTEFYRHLAYNKSPELRIGDELGERNLVSNEEMKDYAKKTTMNSLIGEALMGFGGMNPISVEEKELMTFQLYDPTQKQIYLAELGLLGFNGSRVMHAQLD